MEYIAGKESRRNVEKLLLLLMLLLLQQLLLLLLMLLLGATLGLHWQVVTLVTILGQFRMRRSYRPLLVLDTRLRIQGRKSWSRGRHLLLLILQGQGLIAGPVVDQLEVGRLLLVVEWRRRRSHWHGILETAETRCIVVELAGMVEQVLLLHHRRRDEQH